VIDRLIVALGMRPSSAQWVPAPGPTPHHTSTHTLLLPHFLSAASHARYFALYKQARLSSSIDWLLPSKPLTEDSLNAGITMRLGFMVTNPAAPAMHWRLQPLADTP
jgi:hypothetical protein